MANIHQPGMHRLETPDSSGAEPSPATTDSDLTPESFFYQPNRRRSLTRRCSNKMLELLAAESDTSETDPNQQTEFDYEVGDKRVYTGEATGAERSVWLLGRRYVDDAPPVVVTKPLGVKFPGYIQSHIRKVCPEIQRPILVVGSVGFDTRKPINTDQLGKSHMSWMATDIHSILSQVEAESTGWPSLNFDRFDCTGASQGAMLGLELAAQARFFEREVGLAALIAPAGLMEAKGFGREQLVSLIRIARQFGWNEPWSFCRYLKSIDNQQRQQLVKDCLPTLPIPKNAVTPAIATALEILDAPMIGIGQALRSSGCNTKFEVLLFEDDTASSPSLWQRELDGLSHANVNEIPGDHITGIISPESTAFTIEHLRLKKQRSQTG